MIKFKVRKKNDNSKNVYTVYDIAYSRLKLEEETYFLIYLNRIKKWAWVPATEYEPVEAEE